MEYCCDSIPSQSSTAAAVAAASNGRLSPKKRVHFAANETVHTVPRWTPEEYTLSWYTAIDCALFKLQEGTDAALLRCLISNAPGVEHLPQDSSIYRGLERLLSPQITMEIKERRKFTVKSVLIEQERQRRVFGYNAQQMDEDQLAEVSRCCSEKAAAWARTLGSLV